MKNLIMEVQKMNVNRQTTPSERQKWYWMKEIESRYAEMKKHPVGSKEYEMLKKQYDSARITLNQLYGDNTWEV